MMVMCFAMRFLVAGLHKAQQVVQNAACIPTGSELHLAPSTILRERQPGDRQGDHAEILARGQSGVIQSGRHSRQQVVVGDVDCVGRFLTAELQKQNPPTVFRRRNIRHHMAMVAQAGAAHGPLVDKTMHIQIGRRVGQEGDATVTFPGQ